MNREKLLIGDIGRVVGIKPKTIRYYERINLLPEPKRDDGNNYRIYSQNTVKRLKFIKKSKSLGFTLKEISETLALKDKGMKPCDHVHALLEQKIVDIDKKLSKLTALKKQLQKLEDEWSRMETVRDENGDGICPQIEMSKAKIKHMEKERFVDNC